MGPVDEVSVVLTDEARDTLRRARDGRGEMTIVIGNGCCDSTAPFLFEGYVAGPNETQVAEVAGVPVLLDAPLLSLFRGREVVIDVRPEPGEDSFSCETELGVRFSMERMPALS
jgi:uncharacterized protein